MKDYDLDYLLPLHSILSLFFALQAHRHFRGCVCQMLSLVWALCLDGFGTGTRAIQLAIKLIDWFK